MLWCPVDGSFAVLVFGDGECDCCFFGACWGFDVEGLGVFGLVFLDFGVFAVVGAADPLCCVGEGAHCL